MKTNDSREQNELFLFLGTINRIPPTTAGIKKIALVLSENGGDLSDYLFHLKASVERMRELEVSCQEWKRWCYQQRKWWGFGWQLSLQITSLNKHELNAQKIREELVQMVHLAQSKLDDQKLKVLLANRCSCGNKPDPLAGPINGDLQHTFTLRANNITNEEIAGIAPVFQGNLSQKEVWANNGSN